MSPSLNDKTILVGQTSGERLGELPIADDLFNNWLEHPILEGEGPATR
jgi:hypothetical protein